MSKVTISPILNSLFTRSDRMTKEEANHLISVLSEIGDDTVKITLAQSTVPQNQKANYLTITERGSNHVGRGVLALVTNSIQNHGWRVTNSRKGDGSSWMVYFLREER